MNTRAQLHERASLAAEAYIREATAILAAAHDDAHAGYFVLVRDGLLESARALHEAVMAYALREEDPTWRP